MEREKGKETERDAYLSKFIGRATKLLREFVLLEGILHGQGFAERIVVEIF